MRVKLLLLVCVAMLGITACSAIAPVDDNVQTEFTYDIQVPGRGKADIWRDARDYFASTYGDSRAVFSVQDLDDGTMLGKGLSTWYLFDGTQCATGYEIQFAAKDEKARLRFIANLSNNTGPGQCAGWNRPTGRGYEVEVQGFEAIQSGLRARLLNPKTGSLKDF